MQYTKFSKKQLQAMLWWARSATKKRKAIICDGSVRSGKTMAMTIGFVFWSSKSFNNENFAFCGKTIESLKRNVITPMQKWLKGVCTIQERVSKNYVEITMNGHTNRYYVFGGKDETSYQLVQGITLAGILLDEVALMPRSFVDQAITRCSVKGSKLWFNCNPEGSEHWFYKEWIKDSEKKNALHLHMTMDDNLSLDSETKEMYERSFSGVFYDRYIKGLWVLADGLVYPMWSDNYVIDSYKPDEWGEWYVSADYGTVNPCSFGLWHVTDTKAVRTAEYYFDSREKGWSRTDEEHYSELEKLVGDIDIRSVIIDPSAASFIETIKRHGRFSVRRAQNEVLDGIRRTSTLINAGCLLVTQECAGFRKEVKLYCWNNKAETDTVVKENDHAMDDTRYLVNTVLRRTLLKRIGGDMNDK
ncbi:MAG: PBSX family phage terminase large subunit [Oscillospiraceae bacterium]|nr:PBSX family phage terminase large subunit [Oscillospiraceae bacterium]